MDLIWIDYFILVCTFLSSFIACGLSSVAVTQHNLIINILEVENTLINDITINDDLNVTGNMTCKNQLTTKINCNVANTVEASDLQINNAIIINGEILNSEDATLIVNTTQFCEISQGSDIKFVIPLNGSNKTMSIPMDIYTDFKVVKGVEAFFQFSSNSTQHTSKLLNLPTGQFGITFNGNYTLSSNPDQPVSMTISIVGYDSKLLFAPSVSSLILSNSTNALLGNSSINVNKIISIPILQSLSYIGIQILLTYSNLNNVTSPTLTFTNFNLNVYRLV